MPQKKEQKWIGRTDLSLGLLVFLAALSIPRVVVHDLDLISLKSGLYTLLAVGPLLVYFVFAVARPYKRPFYTFIVLGLIFGLLLALTHQLTWSASWGDKLPHLGGNLEGVLPGAVENLVLRGFTLGSSVMTGLTEGALFGIVALVAQRLRSRLRKV